MIQFQQKLRPSINWQVTAMPKLNTDYATDIPMDRKGWKKMMQKHSAGVKSQRGQVPQTQSRCMPKSYIMGIGTAVNYPAALFLYEKAAKKGHVHAQYISSIFYFKGYGTEPNSEKGMYWLIKAAQQGYEASFKKHWKN